MRLAAASWGFRGMGLREKIDACAELRLSGIEAQLHVGVPKHFQAGMPRKEVEEIRDYAAQKGVPFVSLAVGNDFTVDVANIEHEMMSVLKGIEFASLLKIPVIRIFAGFIEPDKFTDRKFEQVVEALRACVKSAAPRGITLALENHGGITATAKNVERFLDAVDSAFLQLNFDPANFVHSGEDCLHALDVFHDRIGYVHLKDVKKVGSACEYCAVGDGVIDWKTLLPKLDACYEGPCAIEYERAEDVVDGTARSRDCIMGVMGTA